VDTQKLVAIGKVMADDKTIDDYKLKEGDFIVIMVSKPKVVKQKKPEPTPAPVQPSPPVPSAPSGLSAPVPTPPVPSSSSMPHASSTPSSSSSEGPHTGGLLRGEELENTLKEMQDMGFGREE
jgi:UV excision repair protein RAD23